MNFDNISEGMKSHQIYGGSSDILDEGGEDLFNWDNKYEYFPSGIVLDEMISKSFRANLLRMDSVLSNFS
jgi:hypothetical protein